MTVFGNHGKERAEHTFLSCHLNPSPLVIPSGLPVSIPCQGPADYCPLSSIKAISVEVTRACRLSQENLYTDLHLNFFVKRSQPLLIPRTRVTGFSLTFRSWPYNAFALLTLHTLIMALKSMNIILHCLHDNDSGRLLVTCVGGFACTEWELHNRLHRENEPLAALGSLK